jgi:hypothetical protein
MTNPVFPFEQAKYLKLADVGGFAPLQISKQAPLTPPSAQHAGNCKLSY